MHENKKNHFHLNGFTFSLPWSNSEMAYYETLVNKRVKGRKPRKRTLGARDFSSAVSGFCQVFIVTRAKSFSRGFGLQPKMCRPSANIENSRRRREKPLVPRVKKTRRKLRMQGIGGERFGSLPLPLPQQPPHNVLLCMLRNSFTCFTLHMMSYTRKVHFLDLNYAIIWHLTSSNAIVSP